MYYNKALDLIHTTGNNLSEATILNNIGTIYDSLGEKEKALAYYEQVLPVYQGVGDRSGEATILNNIGLVYSVLGDKKKALVYYEQALPILRAIGNKSVEATTLNNIGSVCDDLGDKEKALRYYEQALSIYQLVGDIAGKANTLYNIAVAYYHNDDIDKAINYVEYAISSTFPDNPDLLKWSDELVWLKEQQHGKDNKQEVNLQSQLNLNTEEITQSLIKQLVMIYTSHGDDILRNNLKQTSLSDKQVEQLMQIVKKIVSSLTKFSNSSEIS